MVEPGASTWKGALAATLIGLLFLLGLAEVGLRFVYPQWREFYSGWFMEPVTVPGHGRVTVGHPGFDGYFSQNNGDFRIHVRINEFGLRNDEPVPAAAGRVWVIGDSMAFGWGVETSERYGEVMGAKASRPVYNIASPGADICGYQALLARMPGEGKPRAVVVGLVLENDIRADYDCPALARRSEGAAPPEKTGWTFIGLKHRMTRASAVYNVVAVAVKRVPFVVRTLVALRLIEHDHTYKSGIDSSQVEAAAASSATEIARLKGLLPPDVPFAVLIAPGRFEIRDGDPLYRDLRLKVGTELAARGIDVVDPVDAFKAVGFAPLHFAHDGHWSALGHRIAGEALADWLIERTSP
ncbi:MAG: hypothetical protein HQL33_07160 [Alphaproteobacteria bacterium]|nr:hypothetical protein [Alphaproteobacteria bacterium]